MISLEHIVPEDWDAVDRVLQTLQSLVIDTGGLSVGIRFGQSTLAFAASTEAATATVTHGLGRTPAAVFTTPFAAPAPGNRPIISLGTPNATTFAAGGEVKTAFTGSVSFFWLVIG